jgi:glutamate racemase
MSNPQPVGVFDSGVGGLSVLEKIHQHLPHENLIYVADSAHAPYGGKPDQEIVGRCQQIMDFLLNQQVKAVVLACNTATAAAVNELRQAYGLPIIGMEPAIKPAALASVTGVVGVLATAGTIGSGKFLALKSRFEGNVQILTQACPGLVEHIEQGVPDLPALQQLLTCYVEPLISRGADTLVLGCTHYSLVKHHIAEVAGGGVRIMDTEFAVARELQRRLELIGQENASHAEGTITFHTSGEPGQQSVLLSNFWRSPVTALSLA